MSHEVDAQDVTALSDLESVRVAWLKERPHDAKNHLNQDSVFELAWRLIQAKIQPTVANVKAVHGSGSPNVIQPAIKAFFAGDLQRRVEAPAVATHDVPDGIAQLWDAALREARTVLESEYQVRSEALRTQAAELVEREHDADDRVAEAHHARDASEARMRDVRRDLATALRAQRLAQRLHKQEEVRLAAATDEIAQLRGVVDDARSSEEALDDALAETREALRDREHEMAALRRELEVAATAFAATQQAHAITRSELERTQQTMETVRAELQNVRAEHARAIAAVAERQRAEQGRLTTLLEDALVDQRRVLQESQTLLVQNAAQAEAVRRADRATADALEQARQWRERTEHLELRTAELEALLVANSAREASKGTAGADSRAPTPAGE